MPPACPRCDGTELYEIDHVTFEATDSINGVVPFAFYAHYAGTGESGWFGEKQRRVSVRASARVCGGCGHADLFTKDLGRLRELVAKDLPGIRRIS